MDLGGREVGWESVVCDMVRYAERLCSTPRLPMAFSESVM